ncbi:TPA: hypothetical protein MW319_002647 [Acinetobacter baumannii]|nr:hypothetical protein [Acinetobacter baumannii]
MYIYQVGLPKTTLMDGLNDFRTTSFFVWDELNDRLDCSVCDYRASSWLINNSVSIDKASLIAGELLNLLLGYVKIYSPKLSNLLVSNGVVIIKNHKIIQTHSIDELSIPNFFPTSLGTRIKKISLMILGK